MDFESYNSSAQFLILQSQNTFIIPNATLFIEFGLNMLATGHVGPTIRIFYVTQPLSFAVFNSVQWHHYVCTEASRSSLKPGGNTRHTFLFLKNILVIEEINGKFRLCLIVALRLLLSTKEYFVLLRVRVCGKDQNVVGAIAKGPSVTAGGCSKVIWILAPILFFFGEHWMTKVIESVKSNARIYGEKVTKIETNKQFLTSWLNFYEF